MVTEVGFKLAGGAQPLIILPVFVNNEGPFEFILDTGAVMSVISTQLSETLGVSATGKREAMGAGGKIQISLGKTESLSVGQSRIENIDVVITDELLRIGKVLGIRVDGAIGFNFLKNFRIEIDYKRSTISLDQVSCEREETLNRSVKFKLASLEKPLILLPAHVNGAGPYQFALDTGASATIISPELAESLKIEGESATDITGGGGTVKASVAEMRSLAVDQFEVKNTVVVVADFLGMLSQALGEKIDGVIGYNYLKEFKVSIDYSQERICFSCN